MTDQKPFGAAAEPAQPSSPESENKKPDEVFYDPEIESAVGQGAEIDSEGLPPQWSYEPPQELLDDPPPDSPQGADPEAINWELEARRYQDQYLRSLAELENAKRRFQKEKDENARFASENVIRDILPFLDNLNLALGFADLNDPGVKNLAEGVRMTLKGCLDKLADWGLKEVPANRGDVFDPNVHEAIGQDLDADLPDKAVTKVIGKGYALHGRLLRPAQVLVNKNPSA
jgi:molecular chaperone GrpE